MTSTPFHPFTEAWLGKKSALQIRYRCRRHWLHFRDTMVQDSGQTHIVIKIVIIVIVNCNRVCAERKAVLHLMDVEN